MEKLFPENCNYKIAYEKTPKDAPVEMKTDQTLEEHGAIWKCKEWNGFLKCGALTFVKITSMKKAFEELEKEMAIRQMNLTKEVRVFAGIHGEPFGRNWVIHPNGMIRPNPMLNANEFFWEDFNLLGRAFPSWEIEIVDVAGMGIHMFAAKLKSNCHAIVNYCFSWNDKVLRETLGVNPEKSIITKEIYELE